LVKKDSGRAVSGFCRKGCGISLDGAHSGDRDATMALPCLNSTGPNSRQNTFLVSAAAQQSNRIGGRDGRAVSAISSS
jgi:hypothetical protein